MSEGLSPSQSRYLAEWYQPALSEELLEKTARQLDRCTAEVSAEGTAVALHLMLFMPDDEVAFCLFAAGSRACVEETCRRAGVPYERITRAISRPGHKPSPDGSQQADPTTTTQAMTEPGTRGTGVNHPAPARYLLRRN